MKTVILAGGKGLRYSSDIPKSLALIGDKPIIEHVMEIYSRQKYNEFIIATGWKGEKIVEYFDSISDDHNYDYNKYDYNKYDYNKYDYNKYDYDITFVDTGEDANTGERIKLIEEFIDTDDFFCTYADGIANINLERLKDAHSYLDNLNNLNNLNNSNNLNSDISRRNIGTITVIKPYNQFGVVKIDNNDKILSFEEKPRMSEYTNGGFFIFNKEIFNYIEDGDELEKQVFNRLVNDRKLGAYRHEGFWDTLNTPKDEVRLNKLYEDSAKNNKKPEWYYMNI